MKIYMLCDMEGVSGIFSAAHVTRDEQGNRSRYAEGRKLMTRDVASAALAALEAGVEELVVCDTHGGGDNLLWEDMPTDPRITYETPNAGQMMPSLDASFDGLILLGHHAKVGTMNAFLEHTMNGNIFECAINGISVGEVGLETFYAGHYGVPLIVVQGDAACCAEAEALIPGVTTACVKKAVLRDRASGPHPSLARNITADAIRVALGKPCDQWPKPFCVEQPYTVRLTMARVAMTDALAAKPNIRRVDGRTVECVLEDARDVWRWK